jgi:hypothetical protein
VIKPPGDFARTGVFEIDDNVFITIEIGLVEERSGAMQQARVHKFNVVTDALGVKAREKRSR